MGNLVVKYYSFRNFISKQYFFGNFIAKQYFFSNFIAKQYYTILRLHLFTCLLLDGGEIETRSAERNKLSMYCTIFKNLNNLMILGKRPRTAWDPRARIQFWRAYYGGFSTSRFSPQAWSTEKTKNTYCILCFDRRLPYSAIFHSHLNYYIYII